MKNTEKKNRRWDIILVVLGGVLAVLGNYIYDNYIKTPGPAPGGTTIIDNRDIWNIDGSLLTVLCVIGGMLLLPIVANILDVFSDTVDVIDDASDLL